MHQLVDHNWEHFLHQTGDIKKLIFANNVLEVNTDEHCHGQGTMRSTLEEGMCLKISILGDAKNCGSQLWTLSAIRRMRSENSFLETKFFRVVPKGTAIVEELCTLQLMRDPQPSWIQITQSYPMFFSCNVLWCRHWLTLFDNGWCSSLLLSLQGKSRYSKVCIRQLSSTAGMVSFRCSLFIPCSLFLSRVYYPSIHVCPNKNSFTAKEE